MPSEYLDALNSRCRVCLAVDVRMHCIRNTRLLEVYEKLASKTLNAEDGRPHTLCYICYSQLQRSCRFSDMCLKSDQLLRGLLQHGTEVWSDFKNNTKKKFAKINKAARGTGGGPALQLSLSDLEKRVMQIIGVQAATGMVIEEAGFDWGNVSVVEEASIRATSSSQDDQPHEPVLVESNFCEEDWNTPETSSQPTVAPPSPPEKEEAPLLQPEAPVEEEWRPPPQKKYKKTSDNIVKIFAESEKLTREYARERDRTYEEFERERLRLRNEELRVREREMQERVRQRDIELQLQAAWMELMKEAMNAFVRYMERKS